MAAAAKNWHKLESFLVVQSWERGTLSSSGDPMREVNRPTTAGMEGLALADRDQQSIKSLLIGSWSSGYSRQSPTGPFGLLLLETLMVIWVSVSPAYGSWPVKT